MSRLPCLPRGLLWLLVMLSVLQVSAVRVRAQTDDVRQRARALFEKGLDASDSERWAEAADLFKRSYKLLERPSTVFNLVAALYRLGRYREGVAAAEDYLRMSDSVADAAKRAEVEALRNTMQQGLGEARIDLQPADADVEVDGERVAFSPGGYRLHVDPGLHELVARRTGYGDHEEKFSVESGSVVDLRVKLEPAVVAAVPEVAVPALPEAPPKPVELPGHADKTPNKRLRRALWITGAVVLAGAAATVVALTLPKKSSSSCSGAGTSTHACIPVD